MFANKNIPQVWFDIIILHVCYRPNYIIITSEKQILEYPRKALGATVPAPDWRVPSRPSDPGNIGAMARLNAKASIQRDMPHMSKCYRHWICRVSFVQIKTPKWLHSEQNPPLLFKQGLKYFRCRSSQKVTGWGHARINISLNAKMNVSPEYNNSSQAF